MKRPMRRLTALLTALLLTLVCAGVFALPAAAVEGDPETEANTVKFYDSDHKTLLYAYNPLLGSTPESAATYVNIDTVWTPKKDGYTFLGWYIDDKPVHSVKASEIRDPGVNLYAKWQAITPASTPTPAPSPYSDEAARIVAATATDIAGGEMPVIKKGDVFNVVLQVVDHAAAHFQVPIENIAVRVNAAAFTFTGTAEVSQLYEATDPVTGTSYYTYVLIFRDVIYNGGGNSFDINISYLNTTLEMVSKSVMLAQCAEASATPEAANRTPNLVVRQSSYGSAAITAGTPFDLDVTVFATAGNEDLADVIATVTLPKGITLTGGSLSQYIGGMNPQGTVAVRFQVLPSAAFTDGVADLTIHLTGTGAKSSTGVTSDTVISVPITQPDRFEVTSVECSDTVYIGQGGSITVNFVNKGRNVVANLEAEITGNNLGVDIPRVYVGNVNAGTENSVDFSLYPEMPGPMDGTITLTYEAEDGTVKTLTETFSATAMEMENYYDPGFVEDPGMMEEPPKAGMPVWGWVLIALAVIAAVVVAVVLVRRRKKAKALAALGEADDEDF